MKYSIFHSAITALIIIGLTACGGSGGGGGGGDSGGSEVGYASTGIITGLGSIYVNGARFDTSGSTITIDDNPGAESDLAVGMRVTVNGSLNTDGVSGSATSVSFDDDLEGPVASLADVGTDGIFKTFTLLGREVRISADSTSFDVTGALSGTTFDFDTIANDNHVEISGYLDAGGVMIASRVELKATNFNINDIVELRGTVVGFNSSTDTFTLANVTGITVDATGALVDDSLPGGIVDGSFVEVKGQCSTGACVAIDASEVESGLDDFSDGDNVEVEGIITSLTDQNSFEVNGIPVHASGASVTRIPATIVLVVNKEVEVEGSISNGTLVATKVKDESNDIKVEATILSVDPTSNSFVLEPVSGQTITVTIDRSTEIDDEVGGITNPDDLITSLSGSDFVAVEGYDGGSGTVAASEVERESAADDVIVQGIMDSFNPGNNVTVLGVQFGVDGAQTEFELANDQPANQSEFDTAATDGVTLIKVKDVSPPDGIADEVEIELP